MGIGLVSCCLFLSLLTDTPSLFFESVLLIAFALAGRGAVARTSVKRQQTAMTQPELALGVAFAIVVAYSIYGFVSNVRIDPHGYWDAWAIFNLRARFLATAYWRDAFSPVLIWSHPDYPLLLSAFIARVWRATGGREVSVPAVTAFLFTFATIGVLAGSLTVLKGRTQGFLAGMLLAGTPLFIDQGTAQLADVPLSFFILSALALLALQDRFWPSAPGLALLAGLSAGMGAWTKNEGLLLVAVILPVRTLAVMRSQGRRPALAQAGWFAAGLAPILAVVLFFRHSFATPNAHIGGRGVLALMAPLSDLNRWRIFTGELLKHGWSFGGLFVSSFVVLAIYLACVGLHWDRDRAAVHTALGTLVLVLAGYCVVCIISPFDIVWQSATALNRLLIQLWPGTVFLAFLAARTPDAHWGERLWRR
jgi:hypothetical protein